MNTLKQEKQESEYRFPYHYLDMIEGFRLVEYMDYLKFVRKLIGDLEGKNILDAGCGDGRFCFELRDENAKVTGIDYSRRAINFAKAFNPDARFFVEDLTKFRLKERFDVIVSIETLEHIEPERLRKVFENIHKMLEKDGKLVITVPSKNIKTGSKHFQHFSKEDIKKYIDGLFEIEKVYGHGRIGYFRRKLFKFLLMKCYIWEGLGLKRYKRFLTRFYHKHLGICSLDKGKRLIIAARRI